MLFRKTIIFFLLLLTGSSSFAQSIPNSDFEHWANIMGAFDVPMHWVSNDMLSRKFNPAYKSKTTIKSGKVHSGKYAVKLIVLVSGKDTVNGGIYSTGSLDSLIMMYYKKWGAGFKCGVSVSALTGYYTFQGIHGDSAIVGVDLTRWSTTKHKRDTLVNATMKLGKDTSNYTSFIMPLKYQITEKPDTAFITVGIKGPGKYSAHPGTVFMIDDLQFLVNKK